MYDTNTEFDILIRANDGRLIAATEIKAYRDLSPNVASEMRKTLLEHQILPKNAYFLLISQDHGYLWQESVTQSADQTPLAIFSMEEIVLHYLQNIPGQRLRGTELELIVLQWLFDISAGAEAGIKSQELTSALAQFFQTIRGATIVTEEAA